MGEKDLDKRSIELWHSFWEIQRNIVRCIQSSAVEHGISVPQYMILAAMMREGSMPQKCVREKTYLPKSTLSQAIEGLVQANFLERKLMEDNRREMDLSISEKGQELIRSIFNQEDGIHKIFRDAIQSMSHEDYQNLLSGHEVISSYFKSQGRDDRC